MLRGLQASADNQHTVSPMTWQAINQELEASGAPFIDYERFAARWDADPMLKQIVSKFDGRGLVIKTHKTTQDSEVTGEPTGKSQLSKMAKRATKLGK